LDSSQLKPWDYGVQKSLLHQVPSRFQRHKQNERLVWHEATDNLDAWWL
jgi:hypothetical protein